MKRPRNIAATALAFGLATLLAGCAGPGSYVVLLPSPDGSVGNVVVKGTQGEQMLTQARQGTALNGATPPFTVSQEQLTRDFGAAMVARPALPEQFLLYFERGAELTADSKALLARVLERARARTAVDISVIGHSDTLGPAESNETLALVRANTIAAQLKELGLQNAAMTVESHGERNLLISTADEVAEPRNRRVEVTLR